MTDSAVAWASVKAAAAMMVLMFPPPLKSNPGLPDEVALADQHLGAQVFRVRRMRHAAGHAEPRALGVRRVFVLHAALDHERLLADRVIVARELAAGVHVADAPGLEAVRVL